MAVYQTPIAYDRVAQLLHVAGVESRLAILCLIADAPQPLDVGTLAAGVGVSQQVASHHLAILRSAGFVRGQRSGQHVQYTLLERGRAVVQAVRALSDAA